MALHEGLPRRLGDGYTFMIRPSIINIILRESQAANKEPTKAARGNARCESHGALSSHCTGLNPAASY